MVSLMGSNPHELDVDVKPFHTEVDWKLETLKVYTNSPVGELESEFEELVNLQELVHKVDFVERSDMEWFGIKEA